MKISQLVKLGMALHLMHDDHDLRRSVVKNAADAARYKFGKRNHTYQSLLMGGTVLKVANDDWSATPGREGGWSAWPRNTLEERLVSEHGALVIDFFVSKGYEIFGPQGFRPKAEKLREMDVSKLLTSFRSSMRHGLHQYTEVPKGVHSKGPEIRHFRALNVIFDLYPGVEGKPNHVGADLLGKLRNNTDRWYRRVEEKRNDYSTNWHNSDTKYI